MDYFCKNIVIIEDHADTRDFYEACLGLLGFTNVHLYNCAESFAKTHPHLSDVREVDILFIDYQLGIGHMDGVVFSKSLRGFGLKFPIILTTAYDTSSVYSLFTNETLRKPFGMDILKDVIYKYFGIQEDINDSRERSKDLGNLDFMKDLK